MPVLGQKGSRSGKEADSIVHFLVRVCECESESECVCVYVYERERERVCVRGSMYMYIGWLPRESNVVVCTWAPISL